MEHRLYQCRVSNAFHRGMAGRGIPYLVNQGTVDTWAGERMWFPRAPRWERPLVVILYSKDRTKPVTERPFFLVPEGDIFTDGATYYGDYPEVAIAGAGIVQIDENGEVTNAAYICVPSFLPQDAATAEQLAATAALWLAENFMGFVTGCAAVLSASIRREEAAGPKHPAGGLWRLVCKHMANLSNQSSSHVLASSG